jgi:hypothetical protein
MLNAVTNTASRTRHFVANHKVAITVAVTATATAVVMVKMNRTAVKQLTDFLDEKGLTDQFNARFDNV